MRISYWSSDVCSSDLGVEGIEFGQCTLTRVLGRRTQRRKLLRQRLLQAHETWVGHVGKNRLGKHIGTFRSGAIIGKDESFKRSEEGREGKECVSTCRARGWPDH